MPALDAIKKEWPDINFKIYKHVPDDVLYIEFKNKFIHIPFTANEENLSLTDFKARILTPCIEAIERKIKNA